MAKAVFSLFDMDGFIRGAGAERVDENASRKLAEILADTGADLMLKARLLSNYAGRKQITKEDIKLAAQMG